METTRYAIIDTGDNKIEEHVEFENALAAARERGDCAVVAEHYEYTHSTVEWTPNGNNNWPEEDNSSERNEDG